MLFTHGWTKRPREALLQLDIGLWLRMISVGGSRKAPMRHHPCVVVILTCWRHPPGEQYLVGSLTGAVASQNVTEAFTKVGLARMEIGLDAQKQKPALLQDLQVAQSRKRNLVIRRSIIGWSKLNG